MAKSANADKSATKKPAGVMTTTGNVKTENAAAPEPQESVAEQAKNIAAKAKSADQYEFDDEERARAVYAKLDANEFIFKEGEKYVIQRV